MKSIIANTRSIRELLNLILAELANENPNLEWIKSRCDLASKTNNQVECQVAAVSDVLSLLGNPAVSKSASHSRETGLAELVDGCYAVVELFNPQSASQQAWQKEWLAKARHLIPGCSSLVG